MNNVEKIISLYKYVKELCALKYSVVTDVSKQYWTCFLKDVPEDPDNIIKYYRDRVEEESSSDMVLFGGAQTGISKMSRTSGATF